MRLKYLCVSFLTCSLVAGCVPSRPPIPPYAEPAPGLTTATISGEVTDPGFWTSMANLHSYIAQVDGDAVEHAQDPGRSVVVAEGKRFITLACTFGEATGWSSVPVDIKAGQSYRSKCEVVKNGMFDRVPYAWLEDSSGKTIVEKRQAPVQPLPGGTIPIFIPIHR